LLIIAVCLLTIDWSRNEALTISKFPRFDIIIAIIRMVLFRHTTYCLQILVLDIYIYIYIGTNCEAHPRARCGVCLENVLVALKRTKK
jgi:hypothetical protein